LKSRSKDRLPDFRALTPVKQGGPTAVNLAMVSGNRPSGIAFTECFHAVQAGEYTFTLDSDTGAMLFLHDIRGIDEPMKNAAGKFDGTVRLQTGWLRCGCITGTPAPASRTWS
jgi:hypothetical protein